MTVWKKYQTITTGIVFIWAVSIAYQQYSFERGQEKINTKISNIIKENQEKNRKLDLKIEELTSSPP